MTTPPAGVLPGQRATADLINSGDLIGRLVFFAARDAAQSITTSGTAAGASGNALSWDNLIVDTLGAYDPGQPTRFTPPLPGWYKLTGGVAFNQSAAGTWRGCSWLVNGTLPVAATNKPIAAATANTSSTASARDLPVQLDGVADYVELAPFHNIGSSIDTATGSVRPYIAVYFAAPA